MKQFAVIQDSEDFIQCIAICTDYFQAVGRAYDFAAELTKGKGEVTPLYELGGQTGVSLTVHYGDSGNLKANIFILDYEEKEE